MALRMRKSLARNCPAMLYCNCAIEACALMKGDIKGNCSVVYSVIVLYKQKLQ